MNDPARLLADLLRRAATRHAVTVRSKLLARVVARVEQLEQERALLVEERGELFEQRSEWASWWRELRAAERALHDATGGDAAEASQAEARVRAATAALDALGRGCDR